MRFDDHHHRPAARAQDRRARLDPGQQPAGGELQNEVQQGDQALAVGMQKAEIARPPEAFGQHMLQDQPQEMRTGDGALFHRSGLGVAITEAHLAVVAGDDVLLGDAAPVQITAQVDERLLA